MTSSASGLARFCGQRKERTARNRTQSECVEMQGLEEARPIQEVAGGWGEQERSAWGGKVIGDEVGKPGRCQM